MSEHTRKRRDFIQNITIAVLCVSAVLLFAQTQIYSLGVDGGLLSFLSGREPAANPTDAGQSAVSLTAPVRVAATSSLGRYGSVSLVTDDDAFEPLRGLLEQALSSASDDYAASSADAFFQALERTSIYYDFLTPLPISVLGELVRTSAEEETISARRLILAEENGSVALYLWDGAEGYYRAGTSLSLDALEQTVSQYELGNAFFAYESEDPNARSVAPYSLFLEEEPTLPELSISIPLADIDHLLLALDFNPNTQFRYVDASGAEVVREGGRTLRIHPDGSVSYQSGSNGALAIPSAGEVPTLLEMVTAVNSLLDDLLGVSAGDADLYVAEVEESGGDIVLRFDYQIGGIPVRFTDGESAAEVTIAEGAVSGMTLRIRQYTAESTDSLLLPLRQALAIAVRQEGAELLIGYADSGSSTVSAGWLAV